jgi:undecaprenyl-diphosphatase
MRHVFFIVVALLAMSAVAAEVDPQSSETGSDALGWKQATILGIVEGATEYLPVSSTGHLILTSYTLGLIELNRDEITKPPTLDSFQIVIQVGAILAVLGLYRKRIENMLGGLLGKNREGLKLVGMLLVAFAPAAIIGPVCHGAIQELLFGPVTVAWALLVGGIVMILANCLYRHRQQDAPITCISQLDWKRALIIGGFQVLAMWPGTSRSMVTILGGLAVGMNMVAAAEFSFLLALPTLGGATVFELASSGGSGLLEGGNLNVLLLGILVSAIVAAVAVYGFVHWLTKHGLLPFAIYRIILAAVFLYLLY